MPTATDLQRPRQAVILAGGRGTRLGAITDTIPKPMVPFHGRSFLEYLIEFLRDQGMTRFLLLLGYLPETVREHFGDGSRFGIEIDYSVTPVEDDTGTRLRKAIPKIEPTFLLAYCDNYCPVDIEAMWQRFSRGDAEAMVTVYANDDGYTRDNVVIGSDGFLSVYDKTRTAAGLKGVDIGFLMGRRSILDELPEEDCSFEKTVYPRLIARHALLANVTRHRYYSVGTQARLPETASFLARTPTLLLDRDGVLNRRMPRAEYVCDWNDWVWLPGVLDALRRLNEANWRTAVITNQPGIARGHLTLDKLHEIHGRMRDEAAAAGGDIGPIFYCPHNWDEGCDCRKPRPGMLFQAQRELILDLSRTAFVGDDERDGEAAAAAGCPFHFVTPDRPLAAVVDELLRRNVPS